MKKYLDKVTDLFEHQPATVDKSIAGLDEGRSSLLEKSESVLSERFHPKVVIEQDFQTVFCPASDFHQSVP